MRDITLLAKLKIRHTRTIVALILSGLLGSDIRETDGAGERVYHVYSMVLILAGLFVLWLALLDFATKLFAGIGAHITLALLPIILLIFPMIFIVTAVGHLGSCSVKLTSPDIAYIAASPIHPTSMVLCSVGGRLIGYCLPTLLSGYLIGTCLCSGLALPEIATSSSIVLSSACALLFTLLVFAMLLAGWSVGLLRVCRFSNKAGKGSGGAAPALLYTGAFLILILLLSALFVALSSGRLSNTTAFIGMLTHGLPLGCPVLIAVCAVELLLITGLSTKVSMMKVIDRNVLYADTYALRLGLIYGLDGYTSVRRQRRIANRGALFALPPTEGGAAVISRAFLSHIRQFEGLGSLLFWGSFAAPCAVFLLAGAPLPAIDIPGFSGLPITPGFEASGFRLFLWVYWLMVLLAFPMGVREMTRVFHDDLRLKPIRNRLPFSTLKLLVLDVLPSFVFVNVITLVVISILPWSPAELPWPVVCGVLINTLLVLCAGLDGLKSAASHRAYSYEPAVLICVFLLFLVSLTGMFPLITLGIGMCIAALILLMRHNTE